MIALLNDGAILSIAYDNVHYKDKPEAWNMRMVLCISMVLGIIGVIAAFGLFYLAERVFHLDRDQAQTMMYLKLSVAGHLTIFLTRTRGPFWSIRPAKVLWMAVLGTQIIATIIAVYGLFMTPLGWGWAGFVWGYALVWFLINDRIKLLAYRIFDRTKSKTKTGTAVLQKTEDKASSASATNAKPNIDDKKEAKADAKMAKSNDNNEERKPEIKSETKPAYTTEQKPEVKSEAKEVSAPNSKEEPKLEVKAEAKPADKTEPKPEVKEEVKPAPADSKEESKPEIKAEAKPEDTTEVNPDLKAVAKTEIKEEPTKNLEPKTVQRVHKLYEELGREDVKEAQDWDNAEQKKKTNEK